MGEVRCRVWDRTFSVAIQQKEQQIMGKSWGIQKQSYERTA